MQDKIRRIKGEIRERMIQSRDYYRDALESLRGGHEPGTEIFRGWLEAKMRDAERTILDLTPNPGGEALPNSRDARDVLTR